MDKETYKHRKYSLQNYNSGWKDQFETEAVLIKNIFGNVALDIQHIGSTAVPGLSGKLTVDILVLVEDVEIIDQYNQAFEKVGYVALGDFIHQGSRLFAKNKENERLLNVHVFQKNHPHVKEMISVRDYLRSHPEEIMAYSKLKKELYQKYPDNYAEYRKYKDQYMVDLMKRAGLKS